MDTRFLNTQAFRSSKGSVFYGLFVIFVTGLAIAFTSCKESTKPVQQAPMRSVFRMNLGTEPPELDPAKMDDLTSYSVVQPLMKGLTQQNGHMRVIPSVAASWETLDGGKRYVFHLRPDARWSDGKPVTAHDFVFAWKRGLTPETGAPYAFFLYTLKNAKAFYDGKITDFSQVGVRAVNAQTLQVDLEKPTPFFLSLAAAPVMLPLRQDLLEKDPERFTEAGHFLANGAYQLSQWVHEEKIVLTPNPYFYGRKTPGQAPSVSEVDMLMINDANTSVVMYENNELDFIETTSSLPAFDVRRLRHHADAHTQTQHRINYFGFNVTKPPFNNVKVRQAFAYALDRTYYPKLLQSGQTPISSWVSPGLLGYDAKLGLQYNPQKAKQLLAEAGYPNGKGFPTVTISFPTTYDIRKEAEIAQALWKKNLNVNVRLDNMEWKMLLSKLNEDPPGLFRMGWFADFPDADSYMGVFMADNGNNHTRWKNAQYDRWVQEAATSLDPVLRRTLYEKAQRLLLEQDTVIIPIYVAQKTYLVKPWVYGLSINALNLVDLDTLSVAHKKMF